MGATITLKLEEELKKGFKAKCAELGLDMSDQIRQLMSAWLDGGKLVEMGAESDRKERELQKQQELKKAEDKKYRTLLENAWAWPVGEVIKVDGPGQAEWQDEVGNLFKEDLVLLSRSGYPTAECGGGGALAWAYTMTPAILAGWVPRAESHPVTWEHYYDTLNSTYFKKAKSAAKAPTA
jgi:antitoxin component of RelBE/YafQ-DinJ toxin-antitoxin module